MAAYTRCLRCAGAHRRPASGSGLSLLIPSWHAALSDLGEFDHRFGPEHRCRHWPSLWTKGLGTPNNPAIRFARGTVFAATLVRYCYGLSGCWPPCTDLTSLPANGGFYFQAFDGSVTLPVAGYNYNSVWTPLLTGLSPAGMAASLAALILSRASVPSFGREANPRVGAAPVRPKTLTQPLRILAVLVRSLVDRIGLATSTSRRVDGIWIG